jgi:GTP-binding nuclear protein Ran
MANNTYKIAIIGNGGVGKSTWTKFLLTGEFITDYVPTLGMECHPLWFYTQTHGKIQFNCWDTAGQEKFAGLKEAYLIGANAVIVVYDESSINSVQEWVDMAKKMEISTILLVKNKCEQGKSISHLAKKYPHVEISAQNDIRTKEPYLQLARTLVCDSSLQFV